MKSSSANARIVAVVLLAGVLPAAVSLAAHFVLGDARHVAEPLHSWFELVGSCIALGVAMLLLLRLRHESTSPHLLPVAAALVAMGLVDGLHGFATFGLAWSWLRHGATLAGGLLFALVWLRVPAVVVRRKRTFVLAVAMLAVSGAAGICWRPEWLPAPWGPTGYTFPVKAANGLGGLGFLAAAVFFCRRYVEKPRVEELIFASHTLLFGTSSLLFGFAHVWAADWWIWHGARLLAYAVVLRAAYVVVAALYQQLAHHAQNLEARVHERTADLAAANARFRGEIEDRRRAEAGLVEAKEDWERTFNSVPDLIAILDPAHRIVRVNRAMAQTLHAAPDQSIGLRCFEVVHGTSGPPATCPHVLTMRDGWPHTADVHEARLGGDFLVTTTPMFDAAGQLTGSVHVARDITKRKQAEEALRQALSELQAAKVSAEQAKAVAEEASRAKDHFLAVLSHELRTPLSPVLTGISLVEMETGLTDRARSYLEVIRRNVELESRLIDDLLDLTRIARGKVELDRRPVNLSTVIDRAVEVCRSDIKARDLHFDLERAPEAPSLVVEADAARLQQVVWNLLKNAIKFTPTGGRIGVRLWGETDQAIVEVKDSGVGIEAEALERIFDAFAQAERSITRHFGGLGLGLAISKALVEMHGGSIDAWSDGPGTGARFQVRLPLSPTGVRCDVEAVRSRDLPRVRRAKLRVLVVEDHGDTLDLITSVLELEGHDVRPASDVATALEVAERAEFDLLISDLGLPDGTGLHLLRELRRRGRTMPGIALSGYGQEHDLEQSRAAGFSAHLVKPAEPRLLLETMEKVVGQRESGPALS
jgi:signal transduction histidine kinase/ActR/RegA family two-component response regulator